MRRIVMLGTAPRTQRSHSSVQLPADFSPGASSVPVFHYTKEDFLFDLRKDEHPSDKQKFTELLSSRWENARTNNALNYNLNCMYKCVDGQYNLSVQLNVERGELRRKPMRFRSIREPFNPLRWNFTKLNENEVLIYLKCGDSSSDPLDRHVVAVNASPLERNHSLLIPSLNKCQPQVLNKTAIRLAVDVMLLSSDESMHVLFNSLLGQASVNHLHLHILSWPYDSDLINRRFESVGGMSDVFAIRPPQWMCQAFAFQLTSHHEYDSFVDRVTRCVSMLTDHEQAHNVFFSRAQPIRVEGADREEDRKGQRPLLLTAYVFPRVNIVGAKPPTNFNPAACELAGLLASYTYRFFESVCEQAAVRIIEEEALLPDQVFESLLVDLIEVLNGRAPSVRPPLLPEGLTSPELDELRDSFSQFEPHSPSRQKLPRKTSHDGTMRSVPDIIYT